MVGYRITEVRSDEAEVWVGGAEGSRGRGATGLFYSDSISLHLMRLYVPCRLADGAILPWANCVCVCGVRGVCAVGVRSDVICLCWACRRTVLAECAMAHGGRVPSPIGAAVGGTEKGRQPLAVNFDSSLGGT